MLLKTTSRWSNFLLQSGRESFELGGMKFSPLTRSIFTFPLSIFSHSLSAFQFSSYPEMSYIDGGAIKFGTRLSSRQLLIGFHQLQSLWKRVKKYFFVYDKNCQIKEKKSSVDHGRNFKDVKKCKFEGCDRVLLKWRNKRLDFMLSGAWKTTWEFLHR